MSQFHGIISINDGKLLLFSGEQDLSAPDFQSTGPNLILARHGDDLNLCLSGFAVSLEANRAKIITAENLQHFSETNNPKLPSGHYAGVYVGEKHIRFFTCGSGLRDIYFTQADDYIHFSTDYHTLFPVATPGFDPKSLGSRWLLYNQLSNRSVFRDYTRVCSGQEFVFGKETSKFHVTEGTGSLKQEPANSPDSEEKFTGAIKYFFTLQMETGRPLELSLSGGLDSRVLLSLLLSSDIPFSAHSFGYPDDPDVAMARKLCEKTGVNFTNYTPDEMTLESAIRDVQLQARYSLLNHPATSSNNLGYYKKVAENGSPVIIDGGFGELWRRQFFYKLSVMGKEAILKRDWPAIIPYLRHHKADIFRSEVLAEMERGVIHELEEVFSSLPDPEKIGVENWIDAFALKTRLSNYYAPEQTMIDSVATSFMPYIQNNVLDILFSTPLELRKNSTMLKRIIRKNAPILASIPLVKGSTTVPFSLGSLGSRIWSKFSSLTGKRATAGNDHETQKLFLLKEFVCDLAGSGKVRNSGWLDDAKVAELLKFYDGDTSKKNELAWLISFIALLDIMKP